MGIGMSRAGSCHTLLQAGKGKTGIESTWNLNPLGSRLGKFLTGSILKVLIQVLGLPPSGAGVCWDFPDGWS